MAQIDMNVVHEFVSEIKQPQQERNSVYSAIVSNIDSEGVVWVNIAGSDKETPTALTSAEVKKGDSVSVEFRNNKWYIGGNYTDRSAGVGRVGRVEETAQSAKIAADSAVNEAQRAHEAADQAVADAGRAAEAAENAEASATSASESAASASQSASTAGENASRAQAASQAAQQAALSSLTTDTIHYLATSQGSGVTRSTSGWTTTIQTMTETNKYLWTYHTYTTAGGATTETDPVITGVYGEKGADGTSVTILGSYNTLAELQAAHPTGSLGDAYMVSGDLYVWNGSAWGDVGQIQGPQGPQGIAGTSVTISSIAYAVTTTDSEPSSYPYSTVPTVAEGSWLWTKTTFSDGSSAIMKAKQGESGVGVQSVQPQYHLHTSSTATEQEIASWTWSMSLTYQTGKYIWTRDFITYDDSTTGTSTAIYNQALTEACEDAAEALGLIQEQQEYFWHDTLGAHVLSSADTSNVRYRTDIKGAGFEINQVPASGSEVTVATFGASGAQIGQSGAAHSVIDADGQRFYASDGSTQLANIGYAPGTGASGTATAPFFTFGTRASGVIGNYSMVEGLQNKASGYCSHAEGSTTIAGGKYSHAEGCNTQATNNEAHAEGYGTLANGKDSHAEGDSTRANEYCSHAEGYYTTAAGAYSHAQNRNAIAAKQAQTALGTYNEEDIATTTTHPSGTTSYGQYAVIVGNGTSLSARSNALTVDWSGNVEAAGDITVEGHDSAIGSCVVGTSASVNVSASTYTTITSISLTAGTWIVKGMCSYPTTSTTVVRKAARLYNVTSSSAVSRTLVSQVTNCAGQVHNQTIGYVTLTSAATIAIQGYHDRSTALSITGDIEAIRIV